MITEFQQRKMEEVKKLHEKYRYTTEQFIEFKRLELGCRATFFNYRKLLGLSSTHTKSKPFNYSGGLCSNLCYFCAKNATLTHHIDMNKENNKESNTIPLCDGCHNKIHGIYKNLNITSKVSTVT